MQGFNEVELIEQNLTVISVAKSIKVLFRHNVNEAETILVNLRKEIKESEIERKTLTLPIKRELKDINDTYNKIKNSLELSHAIILQKVASWHISERAVKRRNNDLEDKK